ncbi:hypothetical protein DICVIV_14180, partial [Dictyocaulus viviparus]
LDTEKTKLVRNLLRNIHVIEPAVDEISRSILGTEIGTVAQMDTWVWCVRVRPVSNPSTVVVGCVDGTIACYNLMFSTIHGLHKDRYAFRDNMTDVVVQHLVHHTMTRIPCHDL